MNEELIKRIDECLLEPSELYSEHEKALYVLSDCRAALTKSSSEVSSRYVPMTDDELAEVYFSAEQDDLDGFAAIQSEVIRRAGLEVAND